MVKCRNCGESIVIYQASNGSTHILDKPKRGFTDYHYCGTYEEILSKYMMKKLELDIELEI